MQAYTQADWQSLADKIKDWGLLLGFNQIGIANTDLSAYEQDLRQWLANNFHGEMHYMAKNLDLRLHPELLLPGTLRVITARMDYLPPEANSAATLNNKSKGFISRYALGKDYHKLLRKRLQKLALKIEAEIGPFIYRPFADSAPILEKPLAASAGLGWQGKHTILINRHAGSYFFLGSLLINLPLPVDQPIRNLCGSCSACIKVCPTQAIVAPNQLDARRCISYLTIELKTAIPIEFRQAIGNRIYGCDDCQMVCPWNRYAKSSQEVGFAAKAKLLSPDLTDLFMLTESEYQSLSEGSAMRRINFQAWQRNIAIALGNAPYSDKILVLLKAKKHLPMVQEHVDWAINQQLLKNVQAK